VGKSSFINTLAGSPICVVGADDGMDDSTTTMIRAYQFDLDDVDDEVNYTIQIIDTIGFGDTLKRYTDTQISEYILQEIIGGGNVELINLN